MKIFATALITQLLFTISDVVARKYMGKLGFHGSTFIEPWFVGYFFIRIVAMFGQLYIFSHLELGKTMILFAMLSLVLANLIGALYLNEIISISIYISICLALVALLFLLLK